MTDMNDRFDNAPEPFRSGVEQLIKAIRQTKDGRRSFFDLEAFPWVEDVESSWQAMRVELDQILMALDMLPGFEEIQTEQYQLSQDKRWKIFPFYAYGHWCENNIKRCPETTKAIKKIPGLRAAMFSILQGQKELPPHTGVYCGVLRYQLALKVPKPETLCGISVGDTTAHWEEGKSLIFDDTHMHHAWNRSSEDRVVLFVDFNRPLSSPLDEMNGRVIDTFARSAFIEDASKNWDTWESVHGMNFDELLEGKVGC